MIIRKFDEKDRERIREICFETSNIKFLLDNPDVLYLMYADYYMNEEPDNIFVAADDNDIAQGYILCSPDCKKYVKDWKKGYMAELSTYGKRLVKAQKGELFITRIMAMLGYPAHLHIDLSPLCQRQGIGTQLVDRLISHLKEKNIKGLHLGCSATNLVGNNFYKKYGFKLFLENKQGNIYAIKLK